MYSRSDTSLPRGLNQQSSRTATTGYSTRTQGAKSQVELENEIRELKNTLRALKTANTNWKKTTQMIVYGLLHANFGGRPRDNPVSLSQAMGFLDQVLSRNFDKNTIRSRIDSIKDEFQRDLDEAGKRKETANQPNS